LSRKRPALAFGNIFGSCVSNILGSFSLGLIFGQFGTARANVSEKLYTALLFALTLALVGIFGLRIESKGVAAGLVGVFVAYILAISVGVGLQIAACLT
jgi:Ca2+/Na+ antiporter